MKVRQHCKRSTQYGAVSLFIVIFTALLMTTITVSFMQLMTKDQQQATSGDLSESAYDSAVAGVEDAKRALLLEQDCIGQSTARCNDIRAAIASGECNTLEAIFGTGSGAETKIKQSDDDERLEQAYTCVKITKDTDTFLGALNAGMSPTLVPLRGKDSFNRVVISWNQSKSGGTVNLPAPGSNSLPPVGAGWPESRPSLLRAQLINGKGNFHLSDFDKSGFSNTLFLYPSQVGLKTADFVTDSRRSPSDSKKPELIECKSSVSSGSYACEVTVNMAPAVSAGSQTVFLSLAALYNATDFKVELKNGSNPVAFDGVQPEVDSTGRANDLFRRVVSRIELNDTFNYPLAAIETSGNLCKNFSVTTETSDYKNRCTP